MTDLSKEVTEEEVEAQLPKPVGYRVLVAMPEVDDTYGNSGIIKSSKNGFLQGRGVSKATM